MSLEIWINQYNNWQTLEPALREMEQFEQSTAIEIFGVPLEDVEEPSRRRKKAYQAWEKLEEVFDARSSAKYSELGLPDLQAGGVKVQLPSTRFPDWGLIGNLRFSYRQGAAMNVLQVATGKGIAEIFGIQNPTWYYRTLFGDWQAIVDRAHQVRAELEEAIPRLGDHFVRTFKFEAPYDDAREALNSFLEVVNSSDPDTREWLETADNHVCISQSRPCEFYYSPTLRVQGVMLGKADPGKSPPVYVVYKADPELLDTARAALELIVENAEWVLSQTEPREFALEWFP